MYLLIKYIPGVSFKSVFRVKQLMNENTFVPIRIINKFTLALSFVKQKDFYCFLYSILTAYPI